MHIFTFTFIVYIYCLTLVLTGCNNNHQTHYRFGIGSQYKCKWLNKEVFTTAPRKRGVVNTILIHNIINPKSLSCLLSTWWSYFHVLRLNRCHSCRICYCPKLSLKKLVWTIWAYHLPLLFMFFCTVVSLLIFIWA